MKEETSATMWSPDGPDLVAAITDAAVYKQK